MLLQIVTNAMAFGTPCSHAKHGAADLGATASAADPYWQRTGGVEDWRIGGLVDWRIG